MPRTIADDTIREYLTRTLRWQAWFGDTAEPCVSASDYAAKIQPWLTVPEVREHMAVWLSDESSQLSESEIIRCAIADAMLDRWRASHPDTQDIYIAAEIAD